MPSSRQKHIPAKQGTECDGSNVTRYFPILFEFRRKECRLHVKNISKEQPESVMGYMSLVTSQFSLNFVILLPWNNKFPGFTSKIMTRVTV